MKQRRTIIITAGDPKGIGPEVVIKALTSAPIQNLRAELNFLIVGPTEPIAQTAGLLDASAKSGAWLSGDFNPTRLKTPEIPSGENNNIFLYEPMPAGESRGGLDYILTAIEIMKSNPAAGLVTAPVSKEAINKTGFNFTGHTELLAQKTLSRKVTMMFTAPQLKVTLVTTHIAYKKVLLYLTTDKIFSTIEQTDDGLRKYFNVAQPRIAVCGLNPHAGEGQAFGREESRIIEPAIKLGRQRKINCIGPFPADSVFYRAVKGEFDVVVALYHDQGLIPIKTLAFSNAIQVTLGLPFIRTSPAHGVAYDLAGKGIANPASMIEAVKLAASMVSSNGSLFGNN
ncbi:MAG: 4-hydroxythreonine-4-phosphate dehydrogenase PdxA [Planctomycetes bacterium]|nr:4-hydroxythreonine-4-phosphate dehydrogenase PdxA [Planctomycetota bacterium]